MVNTHIFHFYIELLQIEKSLKPHLYVCIYIINATFIFDKQTIKFAVHIEHESAKYHTGKHGHLILYKASYLLKNSVWVYGRCFL